MDQAQAATPSAFPPSGTFAVAETITLICETPGADIHFTLDGSLPTADSPAFDRFRLPVLDAVGAGGAGATCSTTVKAIATGEGLLPSAVATFDYTIARRAEDVYLSTELHPGIHQIRDYDDTKMMLIVGARRALLLDAGLGRGELRAFVEPLIGDLPLDVVISHGHPDHIVATAQFQRNRSKVFMNHRDLPMVEQFSSAMGLAIDLDRIDDLEEGMIFDLGGRTLKVYELPGHTQGHVVLFDEENGLLFASDAVGSNRPSIPDSLWMQFPGMSPIDDYLSALQVFRAKVAGKIKEIYGGHNDAVIHGETYLDNLQRAAQRLVDDGEAALAPSLRPIDQDVWQVVEGDRLTDPNWAAINVRKETCLSAPPDEIATLSNLVVGGVPLEPGFRPSRTVYAAVVPASTSSIEVVATATSTRIAGLTIDGQAARSGVACRVELTGAETGIAIDVTAPDGRTSKRYVVSVRRG